MRRKLGKCLLVVPSHRLGRDGCAFSFGVLLVVVAVLSSRCEAKLVFRDPIHDPRIYEKAPPGVHVTTVHAYDPDAPRKPVTYNALEVRDSRYFALDPTSGNLTTAMVINHPAGQILEVMVVAVAQGETELKRVTIFVTEYNQFAPEFDQKIYRGELHFNAPIGTTVLRLHARDRDPIAYNAEIYYRMELNVSGESFALEKNGELKLARPLPRGISKLVFGVFAEDGGSPKRWTHAVVEISIKSISEPRDIQALNETESSVEICWSRPQFGDVRGYVVKFREADITQGTAGVVNITSNATTKCTSLRDLRPWKDYEFRIYGWNPDETGMGSSVGQFGTRPNYCHLKVCKNGECVLLNQSPGYRCDCVAGYYGPVCDLFNPCILNPCQNFGLCRNTSHNNYRCECASGFSGYNCSVFNPCALKPSPCLNGATCDSHTSNTFQCFCAPGYYGKTCQYFDPCSRGSCRNGATCRNFSDTDYICDCRPGFSGEHCETQINECESNPCQNNGMCDDGINSYKCYCTPGYKGRQCEIAEHCPPETVPTDKGVFHWQSTAHSTLVLVKCPYGSMHPNLGESASYAKRRCRLLDDGTVAWGKIIAHSCREEGFKLAEEVSDELKLMTQDPNSISPEQLQEAAKQIESIVEYALYDKKIALSMLSIISNVLDVNDSVLAAGDANGTTSSKFVDAVDKFVSEVKIKEDESLVLVTDNVAVKTLYWNPAVHGTDEVLRFVVPSRSKRLKRDKEGDLRSDHHVAAKKDRQEEPLEIPFIKIPDEAVRIAEKHTTEELRIKFVSYQNDKLFRTAGRGIAKRKPSDHVDRTVLQASINNISIQDLSDPVMYILSTSSLYKALCVYWNEGSRTWSAVGLSTNQTDNYTICFSTHLTAFSVLFDPTPYIEIPEDHKFALSVISYFGCALSILGLTLTTLTYSLFRCLNRDHSGKILLNLCISMLFMNASFLLGSLRSEQDPTICIAVAILTHYFLLTSLGWMCVEAINMYQLLIYVFASAETRFMLKRCLLAWGLPLLIVGICVGIDVTEYYNKNEYCMLSPENPYVYYIAFLTPCCLILLINLTVFIMVTKVLFTPRMTCKAGTPSRPGSNTPTVSAAQVRGAFTVMTLLGVTWVFGAFAIGEAKLFFQYVFCIANSLQGFIIFIVRCVHYPEARNSWLQLLRTGTLKKYRGVTPPGGSWYANSNSSNKHNGHSSTTRSNSDTTSTVVFNTNFWSRSGSRDSAASARPPPPGVIPTRLPSYPTGNGLLKNVNLENEVKHGHPYATEMIPVTDMDAELQKLNGTIPESDREVEEVISNPIVFTKLPEVGNKDSLASIEYIDMEVQEAPPMFPLPDQCSEFNRSVHSEPVYRESDVSLQDRFMANDDGMSETSSVRERMSPSKDGIIWAYGEPKFTTKKKKDSHHKLHTLTKDLKDQSSSSLASDGGDRTPIGAPEHMTLPRKTATIRKTKQLEQKFLLTELPCGQC